MTSRRGAVLLPWIFILLMIGSLLWLLNRLNQGILHTDRCRGQLETVYQALLRYERENGRLPSLELYPADPDSEEGLVSILENQPGVHPELLVCPSAPEVLRQQGVTYLWNTALNQSSLTDRAEITWVLVDMQALDDQLPGPHFGHVHILYTDGRVERSQAPPHSLPVRFD